MMKRADEVVENDLIDFLSGSYGEVKAVYNYASYVSIRWENPWSKGKFDVPRDRMFSVA